MVGLEGKVHLFRKRKQLATGMFGGRIRVIGCNRLYRRCLLVGFGEAAAMLQWNNLHLHKIGRAHV